MSRALGYGAGEKSPDGIDEMMLETGDKLCC
jgi:hypothetical protein